MVRFIASWLAACKLGFLVRRLRHFCTLPHVYILFRSTRSGVMVIIVIEIHGNPSYSCRDYCFCLPDSVCALSAYGR